MNNLRSSRGNQTPNAHFWSVPRFPGRSNMAAEIESVYRTETEMDSELICAICLELYTYPIILPCSHVLCRSPCAEHLFDFNFIRCPVCRDNCYVSGGISSLPRVIALENIINRFKKDKLQKEKENSKIEQSCEKSDTQKRHGNDKRGNRKLKAGPNGSSPGSKSRVSFRNGQSSHQNSSGRNLCPEHSSKLSFYCSECATVCCVSCKKKACHSGHQIISLENAYSSMKTAIEESIRKLQTSQSTLVSSLESQRDKLKDMQQAINKRRNDINTQCDALLAEIENKRSFFLADLDYEERILQTDIEEIIKAMETLHDSNEALQIYSNETVKQDITKFLQEASSLNEKLSKALEDCDNVQLHPNEDNNIQSKIVDFRREKSVLRNLHYLTAPSTPVVDVTRCSRSENTVVLVIAPPNSVHDVIDQYEIHFCSEEQKSLEIEENMLVKNTPDDRLIARGVPNSTGMAVVLIENMCKSTTYYFCVSASNSAGKSANSEVVQCTTLLQGESVIPSPIIVESLCRQFTSSIQIYSSSPQDVTLEQNISHFLLYRPVGQSRAWRTLSIYGRQDHRVFGLDPNVEYEFVILACNPRGECQISNKVSLQTEPSTD